MTAHDGRGSDFLISGICAVIDRAYKATKRLLCDFVQSHILHPNLHVRSHPNDRDSGRSELRF